MIRILIATWLLVLAFVVVSTVVSFPGGATLDALRLCAILLLCATGFLALLAPVLGRSENPSYVRPTPPEFESQSLDASPGIVIAAFLHDEHSLIGDQNIGG